MMRKWLKVVVVLMMVTALAVAGTAVLAQGDGDDEGETTPPFGFFGGRFGGMFGGFTADDFTAHLAGMPMVSTLAEALGMEPDALVEAWQDGQTIAEIAEAQGVSQDALVEALSAVHAEELAVAVEAGTITQEQADAMQALHEANMRAGLTNGEGFFGMRSFFGGMMDRSPLHGSGGFFGGMRGGRRS